MVLKKSNIISKSNSNSESEDKPSANTSSNNHGMNTYIYMTIS